MRRYKPFILPAAILLGLLFHSWAPYIAPAVPVIIFIILLLNFAAVDLRSLKFNRLDAMIMAFQAVVSLGGYFLVLHISGSNTLAQGALICVLCPVASSVVVVASALGADRRTTTGYTIYGNLLVTAVAPVYFSFIGINQDMAFVDSAWMIFKKISSVIALPFFVALFLQAYLPKVRATVAQYKDWAFYLWSFALFTTLGQTINFIFLYHAGHEVELLWLGVVSLVSCVMQFVVGRAMGMRGGEKVAGGQLLGQKNTAIGIWMTSIYLTPLASVALAFYAIYQNLFNSWQIWLYERRKM